MFLKGTLSNKKIHFYFLYFKFIQRLDNGATVIYALLPLKAGDQVGIFAHTGLLYQQDEDYITRFFGYPLVRLIN